MIVETLAEWKAECAESKVRNSCWSKLCSAFCNHSNQSKMYGCAMVDGKDLGGDLADLWSCQKAWLQLQLPTSGFMATLPIFKQHFHVKLLKSTNTYSSQWIDGNTVNILCPLKLCILLNNVWALYVTLFALFASTNDWSKCNTNAMVLPKEIVF